LSPEEEARKKLLSKIIRPNVLLKEKVPIGERSSEEEYLEQGGTSPAGRPITLSQKIQREREKAYRSGFEDGKQMGLEEGRKQGEKIARDFFSLLKDIKIQRENIFKESEQVVLKLALALASKIICSAVEVRPEVVLDVARNAIHHLVDKNKVVLRVNPKDYELIKLHQNDLLASIDGIKSLEIEEDVRVKPGGCLIETDSGNVDARLENQMQVLKEALLDKSVQKFNSL
jgi:flagellar assembly protein FliH